MLRNSRGFMTALKYYLKPDREKCFNTLLNFNVVANTSPKPLF